MKTKTVFLVIAIMAMLVLTVYSASAEPRIVAYNLTIATVKGDAFNATTCQNANCSQNTTTEYSANGNVSITNSDFNVTYSCGVDQSVFRNVLTIREVPSNCQTDDLISTLLNTTQTVANNSVALYTAARGVLDIQNQTNKYIDDFADCRQVNGEVSTREQACKTNLDTCNHDKGNASAELTICTTALASKGSDLSACQNQVSTSQQALTTCRTDLDKNSGIGSKIFPFILGGIAGFLLLKRNEPKLPEEAQFPQG